MAVSLLQHLTMLAVFLLQHLTMLGVQGILLLCLSSLVTSLASCNSLHLQNTQQIQWLKSGSIVFSQPLPSSMVTSPTSVIEFPSYLASKSAHWIKISKEKKLLELMEEDRVIEKLLDIDGIKSLNSGSYELIHKQRHPSWYAPDSYYITRALPIPPKGDKARYLKGALGKYALFIAKDIPLHSGPVWSEEIGGVRISENNMAKIYYSLNLGSLVVVE